MAGVRFSCISRVPPVSTSGVWIVRNLPPQITPFYPTLTISVLFFFVKNFYISQSAIPFFFIYSSKRNNGILISWITLRCCQAQNSLKHLIPFPDLF